MEKAILIANNIERKPPVFLPYGKIYQNIKKIFKEFKNFIKFFIGVPNHTSEISREKFFLIFQNVPKL